MTELPAEAVFERLAVTREPSSRKDRANILLWFATSACMFAKFFVWFPIGRGLKIVWKLFRVGQCVIQRRGNGCFSFEVSFCQKKRKLKVSPCRVHVWSVEFFFHFLLIRRVTVYTREGDSCTKVMLNNRHCLWSHCDGIPRNYTKLYGNEEVWSKVVVSWFQGDRQATFSARVNRMLIDTLNEPNLLVAALLDIFWSLGNNKSGNICTFDNVSCVEWSELALNLERRATHVENFLFQISYVFSVWSIFKCNPGKNKWQVYYFLIISIQWHHIEFKRERKRRIIVYGSVARYGPQSIASARD